MLLLPPPLLSILLPPTLLMLQILMLLPQRLLSLLLLMSLHLKMACSIRHLRDLSTCARLEGLFCDPQDFRHPLSRCNQDVAK
jgi:hypothetical protein